MDQANIPPFLPIFISVDLDLLGCHAWVATCSKVLSMSKSEELIRLCFVSLECFDFQLATYSKYKAKDPLHSCSIFSAQKAPLNSCSIFSIYAWEILPVLNYFTFPHSSSSTTITMTPSCTLVYATCSFLLSHTLSSMGNAQEMVKQAKILAEATSALVNAIKLEADAETDPDARRRLLDAAKSLADATSKMVEAAKGAARNPHDEAAQEALRKAAEHLR